MPSTIHRPSCIILYLHFTFGMLLTGCATSQQDTLESSPTLPSPLAIVNGQATALPKFNQALHEAAGRRVLQEHILLRALVERCNDRDIEITPEMLANERTRIGEALGFDAAQALPAEVLDDLRVQRGLGPIRFEQMLRRNAMLRTLVGNPSLSPEQIEQAIDKRYGQRYRVRLFVSDSLPAATAAKEAALQANAISANWIFADQCASYSLHPSAPRGGLVESLSPSSPAYPQAVRAALKSTPTGSCSNVISTEAGFVVMFVESVILPTNVTDSMRSSIKQQLRQDAQRNAMQQLAQDILASQDVIVMDKSLHWSWTNGPE